MTNSTSSKDMCVFLEDFSFFFLEYISDYVFREKWTEDQNNVSKLREM